MSVDNTGGNYYDQSQLKNLTDIPQNNTKYDSVLDQLGENENREIGDILAAHSATPDTLTGSQLQSARNACNAGAAYRWFVKQRDFDAAREFKTIRNEARAALITKLKTEPETNTQSDLPVVVSSYQSSPLSERST